MRLCRGTEAYLAANDSAYLRCAVFACKDKDAVAAVKKLIQTYIDDSIDAKYNVDEVALLQKVKVHTMGNYVAVAVTNDTENVNKVIDQYLNIAAASMVLSVAFSPPQAAKERHSITASSTAKIFFMGNLLLVSIFSSMA